MYEAVNIIYGILTIPHIYKKTPKGSALKMKMIRRTVRICALLTALVLSSTALLCSCAQKKDTVMTLGDYKVSFEHYRYLYMNIRSELEASGITEAELDAEARESALASLKHTASVQAMADKRNISLTSDEHDAIDDYIAAAVEDYGSEEEYKKALEEAFMSEDFFRYALELQQIEAKLRAHMTDDYTGELAADDATIEADVYKNFFYAAQVLIKNDMVDSPEENLEIAKTALDRAKAGEDFDALIDEYGEDASGGYYCFTSGQLLEEIEAAVKAAAEDTVCPEVIQTDAGYHVIKRLPIDPEYVNENFDSIREAYLARKFNELQESAIAALEIETTELYEQLSEEVLISGSLPENGSAS